MPFSSPRTSWFCASKVRSLAERDVGWTSRWSGALLWSYAACGGLSRLGLLTRRSSLDLVPPSCFALRTTTTGDYHSPSCFSLLSPFLWVFVRVEWQNFGHRYGLLISQLCEINKRISHVFHDLWSAPDDVIQRVEKADSLFYAQVGILSTTSLEKRLLAINKALDHLAGSARTSRPRPTEESRHVYHQHGRSSHHNNAPIAATTSTTTLWHSKMFDSP